MVLIVIGEYFFWWSRYCGLDDRKIHVWTRSSSVAFEDVVLSSWCSCNQYLPSWVKLYPQDLPEVKRRRRAFLFQLSRELVSANITNRAAAPMQPHTREAIKTIGLEVPGTEPAQNPRTARVTFSGPKKCMPCRPRQTNTRTWCSGCFKPLCTSHQNMSVMCDECMNQQS